MPAPSSLFPRRADGVGFLDEEVELGSIEGVFGVRGEVRVHLHNRESELLARPRAVVLVDPSGGRFDGTLQVRPGAGGRVLGTLTGLTTPSGSLEREVAATLKGWRFGVAKAELPKLRSDELYVWQLEGLQAVCDGEPVGRVDTVHATPGGDVLEIVRPGGDTLFVILASDLVLGVDVDAGTVTLDRDALDV